jgi:hypothetical protein
MVERNRASLDGSPAELPTAAGPSPTNPQRTDATNSLVREDTDEMLVEWDVKIPNPPQRSRESVTLRFTQGGRRPVRINDEPRD